MCAWACTEPAEQARDLPPNVLVVLLDDIGVDKVPGFGFHPDQPVTPTFNRLTVEGVRFSRAYAHPVCSPTRAAALTGRYPRRHGIGEVVAEASPGLLTDAMLVPEALRLQASDTWTSALLGKWHLSSESTPEQQGFDWFAGTHGNISDFSSFNKVVRGQAEMVDTYATTDTTNDAVALLQTLPAPWFTWVAYHAAHVPLHVPPKSLVDRAVDASSDVDRFNAMVEALDKELGRLLFGMPAGLREHTVIIVLADNGTEEEVVTPPFDPKRSKVTVYEGGVHVPLWVLAPDGVAGGTSNALVHVVDIFATVLDVAGVDAASLPVDIDGMSLLPYVRDPDLAGGRKFVATERFLPNGPPPYYRDHVTVRDDTHKLVERHDPGREVKYELYRLSPGALDEGPNLIATAPLDPEDAVALARLKDASTAHRSLPYEGR